MVLFCNFGSIMPKDMTDLQNRLCGLRERALPMISLNLQKLPHFWSGNWPVSLAQAEMVSSRTGKKNRGFFAADPGLES
jgi:hypothetical protein